MLHDVSGDKVYELLLSGAVDCDIHARTAPLPERFRGIPLYSEPFVLATGRSHPLASENCLFLRDLAGQIYFDRLKCAFRDQFIEALKERDILVETAMRSEREGWIQSRVASGHGVAMMPLYSIFTDQIVPCRLDDFGPVRKVEFITVADRPHPKSVDIMAAVSKTMIGQPNPVNPIDRPGANDADC